MITSFGDKNTEKLFCGFNSTKFPASIKKVAIRKLDMLNAAHLLSDLLAPPGNKLEKLSGNLRGFYSIRINEKYRIIFQWEGNNAHQVSTVDYH